MEESYFSPVINVKYLITHRISLDELIKGFEMVDMHNGMEVVVK